MANKDLAELGRATRFKKGDPKASEAGRKSALKQAQKREVIRTAEGMADYIKQIYGIELAPSDPDLELMNRVRLMVAEMPVRVLRKVVADANKEDSTISGLVAAYGEERLRRLKNGNTDDISELQDRAFGTPSKTINASVQGLDAPRGFEDD